MRIAIVTDAWRPQVNGVVTTLMRTAETLEGMGHKILVINPENRRSVPCPTYPEIRLSVLCKRSVFRELDAFGPECIHIATEGPLGMAARRYCLRRKLKFTTSYHTQFPEYVRARAPIPKFVSYAWLRRFHAPASRTMVPTPGMQARLERKGFEDVRLWSRGVDTELFTPHRAIEHDLPRPIWVYTGRVAVEKNLKAFLQLDLPGSKMIIGNGPDLKRLQATFPDVYFAGYRFGKELADYMAGCDVFVFPSRTDTFGIVMLEAMACGLPIAAYPVTGPIDVVAHHVSGILNEDLETACMQALRLDRKRCRDVALDHSWQRCTEQFASLLRSNAPSAKNRNLTLVKSGVFFF